ncbi:MAG: glycosyltransferase family 39 protein [Candidatus Microsaccharimonas sp.]
MFTTQIAQARLTWSTVRVSREIWVVGSVFIVAILSRFVMLGMNPGFEWDEPVYTYVAGNLATNGLMEAKTEFYRTASEPYLYHPPFYFGLLAGWFQLFGVGIAQARVLASIGSIVMLAVLYILLREILGWKWAVATIALLSIDGWLVFTNRVSWIENTMMPIGVVALLLYYRFVLKAPEPSGRREKLLLQAGLIGTGLLFGAVTVYKHVGVYFFLALLVCWLVTRIFHKRHLTVLYSFSGVIVVYVILMVAYFRENFIDQVATQVRRSFGTQESRGALTSIGDVLGPLTSQYAIYWSSVVLVATAVVLLVIRAISIIRKKSTLTAGEALLFSWAAGSVIFFIVLQLKIPHYFLMLEIPLFCYLMLEVQRYAQRKRGSRNLKTVAVVIASVLVIANAFALTMRLGVLDSNPLQQTAEWTAKHLPADATVISEESVGLAIQQPYCKIAFARNCPDVEYIITYTSATQKVPDTRSVEVMLENATLLQSFSGFKEEIRIYRIDAN